MTGQITRKRTSTIAKNEDNNAVPSKVIKNDRKLDKLPKAKLVERCESLEKAINDLQEKHCREVSSLNKKIYDLQQVQVSENNKTNVHTQTYPQNDIDFNCGVCIEQFTNESNLWSHMDIEHDIRKDDSINDFKCDICDEKFGEDGDVKYHKKERHQLMAKPCKYFVRGMCHFNEKTCWFSHTLETIIKQNCKYCGESFQSKNDLMKHRKIKHNKNIAICREQENGNCKFGNDCWFKHITPNQNQSSQKQNNSE